MKERIVSWMLRERVSVWTFRATHNMIYMLAIIGYFVYNANHCKEDDYSSYIFIVHTLYSTLSISWYRSTIHLFSNNNSQTFFLISLLFLVLTWCGLFHQHTCVTFTIHYPNPYLTFRYTQHTDNMLSNAALSLTVLYISSTTW